MNVSLDFPSHPFCDVTVADGLRSANFHFRRPLFYAVKRGIENDSFDQALKKQAILHGVNFHFKQSLAVTEGDIVATGPIVKEIFAVDKGIVFQTDLPDTAIGLINDAAAYQGYAYLIVAKGYACMCTVLFDRFEDVHRCFEETTRIFKNLVGLDIQNAKSVGGIGGFALKNVFQSNGRLYVGEAAGIQDFLWGFGLRDAMASGFLAAQSLLEGRSYEEMAKVYFSRKLRASLVNRYLWEKFITRRYFYFMGRVKNAEHGVTPLTYAQVQSPATSSLSIRTLSNEEEVRAPADLIAACVRDCKTSRLWSGHRLHYISAGNHRKGTVKDKGNFRFVCQVSSFLKIGIQQIFSSVLA